MNVKNIIYNNHLTLKNFNKLQIIFEKFMFNIPCIDKEY